MKNKVPCLVLKLVNFFVVTNVSKFENVADELTKFILNLMYKNDTF